MKTGRNIAVLAVSLLAVLALLWIGRGGREPEKTEVSVTEKQAMTFAEGEIRRIAGEGGPDCTWDDTTVILQGRPLYGPDDRCNGYVCRLATGGMETGYLQVDALVGELCTGAYSFTGIPAYEGLEHTWVQAFDQFDYKLDVQKCVDMFPYGVQSVNNASRPNWKTQINDALLKIYSGEVSLDEGLAAMQKLVDEAKAP